MAAIRDVFISYARADHAWVKVLAENLHQSGLEVFLDQWEIGPGDVLVNRLDEGLRARNGVAGGAGAAVDAGRIRGDGDAGSG